MLDHPLPRLPIGPQTLESSRGPPASCRRILRRPPAPPPRAVSSGFESMPRGAVEPWPSRRWPRMRRCNPCAHPASVAESIRPGPINAPIPPIPAAAADFASGTPAAPMEPGPKALRAVLLPCAWRASLQQLELAGRLVHSMADSDQGAGAGPPGSSGRWAGGVGAMPWTLSRTQVFPWRGARQTLSPVSGERIFW